VIQEDISNQTPIYTM